MYSATGEVVLTDTAKVWSYKKHPELQLTVIRLTFDLKSDGQVQTQSCVTKVDGDSHCGDVPLLSPTSTQVQLQAFIELARPCTALESHGL